MISSLDVRDVEFDSSAVDVSVNEDAILVRLADGREISAPLAWYPRLLDATPEQRNRWRLIGGGYGINWEELDEDISVRGLLRIH
jgi:hypothetical protein